MNIPQIKTFPFADRVVSSFIDEQVNAFVAEQLEKTGINPIIKPGPHAISVIYFTPGTIPANSDLPKRKYTPVVR